MPCLIAGLALFFPRIVIILLAIFSDYLGSAYTNVLWPILGFFFLPYTTLVYAWAHHSSGGSISGLYIVAIVIAVLCDIGAIGGGAGARKVTVRRS